MLKKQRFMRSCRSLQQRGSLQRRGSALLVLAIATHMLSLSVPWSPTSAAANFTHGLLLGISMVLSVAVIALLFWSSARKRI